MLPPNQSLPKHVVPLEAGAHVTGAFFLGAEPALALGDGVIRLGHGDGVTALAAHPDASILVADCDGARLITGGDDGRVVMTNARGDMQEIADEKGRWIDAVTLGAAGACAWSAGKNVRARDGKGAVRTLATTSTSRGLCFAPKGYRLGVSHVDGASLWFPNTDAAPERLEWKGVHLDLIWSPDGKYVVTSMQENQLHGWRLPEKAHMRMSGYPAKTRSMHFSYDGNWMATSGAEAAIIWPFSGAGPTGKAPRECGVRPQRVTRVAFHPGSLVLAIGYEDGLILLVRLTDASELLVRAPAPGGPVTALCWDAKGDRLVFGTEDGAAGLLTLPGA
jgi:WD40 repeat protein